MGKSNVASPSTVEFTIGGRTYELVPFLKEGESCVSCDAMVERAKELNANLGQDDGEFILKNQEEIPQEFRKKFYLVFTAWRNPSNPQGFACLAWGDGRGYQGWLCPDDDWGAGGRLVRRVS